MARETILTYDALVTAALLVKDRADLWIVLGRQTPWADEELFDSPTQGTHDVEEPFVAIRATIQSMAKEVSAEDYNLLQPANRAIAYSDSGYVYIELVDDSLAYSEVARYIYVEATYSLTAGMPEDDFRIYGVYSGLVPTAGYENAEWLVPGHVEDYGILLSLSHGKVCSLVEVGAAAQIPVLIEFNI